MLSSTASEQQPGPGLGSGAAEFQELPEPDQDFSLRFHTGPQSTESRTHGAFHLLYVYEGEVTLHHAGGDIALNQDDAVLCGPATMYAVQADAGSCLADFSLPPRVLQANPGLFHADLGVVAAYFLRACYDIDPVRKPLGLPSSPRQAPRARRCVEIIARELSGNPRGWDLGATAILTRLFIELAHGDRARADAAAETRPGLPAQVLLYIQDHYRDVSLRSLGQAFNYSPTHMSRLVQQYTGQPFATLVRRLKIHHAMNYLTHTTLGLDRISQLVGFNSASYLTRVFRSEYGLTPGQFRAKAERV